ncbi:unnamed protein product [Discula destructiva]
MRLCHTIASTMLLAWVVQAVNTVVDLGHARYQGVALRNGVTQWLGLRYAAPCNGTNRFRPPQPPAPQSAIQDASANGPLCLCQGCQETPPDSPDFLTRERVAEDCLFLGIFAPSNATATSKLPIMFFVGGGGFTSNANGQHNGSNLVIASEYNMIVVRIAYRVGMLGFVSGLAVDSGMGGAASNNGFRDMVAAAQFVKEHAVAFGGDPDHIVLTGDSSGAEAIVNLLVMNNGTGWPGLFVGAAAESVGSFPTGFPARQEETFTKYLNKTGCLGSSDPIRCLGGVEINLFQNLTSEGGWGPVIDNDLLVDHHVRMWEMGRFQKIPMIFGSTTNEGTPDFISNQTVSSEDELRAELKKTAGWINSETIEQVLQIYPPKLNQMDFFGRDVSPRENRSNLRQENGTEWQRDAMIKTELKVTCSSTFFSDMAASINNTQSNWHYRYNLIDNTPKGTGDKGLFSPHTHELYPIFGPNATDGGDPLCIYLPASDPLTCAPALAIIQAYWTSFVRTLNPNTHKHPQAPAWEAWSIAAPRRIVLGNVDAAMEVQGQGAGEWESLGLNQRERCLQLMGPLAKAVALGLEEGAPMPVFANGTRPDPRLVGAANATGLLNPGREIITVSSAPGTRGLRTGQAVVLAAFSAFLPLALS